MWSVCWRHPCTQACSLCSKNLVVHHVSRAERSTGLTFVCIKDTGLTFVCIKDTGLTFVCIKDTGLTFVCIEDTGLTFVCIEDTGLTFVCIEDGLFGLHRYPSRLQGLDCSRGLSCPGLDMHRLVGLVVKASASGVEDPEFESCLHCGDFSGSSHTSDLKIGVIGSALGLVGLVSVYSTLRLGEVESLVCNFYLNVAACMYNCLSGSVSEINWHVACADLIMPDTWQGHLNH